MASPADALRRKASGSARQSGSAAMAAVGPSRACQQREKAQQPEQRDEAVAVVWGCG